VATSLLEFFLLDEEIPDDPVYIDGKLYVPFPKPVIEEL
jgi:hypothetical protein